MFEVEPHKPVEDVAGPDVGGVCQFVKGKVRMSRKINESGVVVPHQHLSDQALQGLLEEFVSRDGTDSGYTALSLQQRVDQVRRQLDRGEVAVVFDEVTQTANIVPVQEIKGDA